MKNSTKFWIILVLVCTLVLFGRECLIFTDNIETSGIYAFSVDSEENIYIGTRNEITVIQEGTPQRKIYFDADDGYYFCIENDEILVAYGTDLFYRFDLEGNKLPTGDVNYDEIKAASSERSVNIKGHYYEMHKNLGIMPYTITCDGIEVYRMTTLDYIFNGLPFFVFLALVMLGTVVLVLVKLSEYQAAKENGEDVFKAIFG